jgi:3-keto-disaccharide hydrolase
MRFHFCLPLVLLLALPAIAADDAKPKPNTLTPKEIADGWILLFDGESTFGWKAVADSKWQVKDGELSPEGDKPARLLSTAAFSDYNLYLEFKLKKDAKAEVILGCDAEGKPTSKNRLATNAFRNGDNWATLVEMVRNGEVVYTNFLSGTGGMPFVPDISKANPPITTSGFLALSGSNFVVRNIKLKPVDPKPIFNGKDLDNWKVFQGTTPGKAKVQSEFTVTKDGWISLKNGPGDLQSKDAWGDFVLQIECKSNGKALNSGVFFRCRPDEYQMGYEAQIHNGFTEKPEKKYKIEEYDPKTNELKDTKEVAYTATDYGTGAIYRRIPARREAAKDNEWFTMTVVAQGRHIATWVDGIQVVDWTDNRPLKDNARNGCRLEKGPISLQGHDATTDLNFRNIRIAELPPLVEKK